MDERPRLSGKLLCAPESLSTVAISHCEALKLSST